MKILLAFMVSSALSLALLVVGQQVRYSQSKALGADAVLIQEDWEHRFPILVLISVAAGAYFADLTRKSR